MLQRRVLLLGLLLAAAPSAEVVAQSDTRLAAAVRDAQEGQGDSARATVRRLLETTPATDTLYPQILYTAAIIATEAAEMRRQLQRVSIEFPASSWADDALLRLVQLDYATHQLDGAARTLERIAVDFPASPLIPTAAYWAGRTYFDLKRDADACRWLADGMARAGGDVEVQMQLGYLYQRCGVTGTPSPGDSAGNVKDTLAPASLGAPTAAPAPAPAPAARFRVQIAAVGAPAAADAAARKAQELGYRTVTVQQGGLYKVRVGEFQTRADAQQAAASLKTQLGGTPFIVAE